MLPGNAAGSVRPAGGPSRLSRTTAVSATGKLLLLHDKLLACRESWRGRPALAIPWVPRVSVDISQPLAAGAFLEWTITALGWVTAMHQACCSVFA